MVASTFYMRKELVRFQYGLLKMEKYLPHKLRHISPVPIDVEDEICKLLEGIFAAPLDPAFVEKVRKEQKELGEELRRKMGSCCLNIECGCNSAR